MLREIILLAHQHVHATACQVAGDAGAIDAAAHDEHVHFTRQRLIQEAVSWPIDTPPLARFALLFGAMFDYVRF